jgi:tRNA A-37 threonylcarbamoyl transferase component Bud32
MNKKPNFESVLIEKIPILSNDKLFSLILQYCTLSNEIPKPKNNSTQSPGAINPRLNIKYNKENAIKNINTKLSQLYNLVNDPFGKNGTIVLKKNKYKKTQKINFKSLSEAIINVALYYYDRNATVNSYTNIINNNNKKMEQVMNIAKGKPLGLYIIEDLYVNSNEETNEKFFNILKSIALKLSILQNYNFIHGDFHSGNIIINPKNIDEITFIDFGYSTIMLPDSNLILTTPMNENLEFSMNFKEYPQFKTIDLFHLFRDFNSFDSTKFHSSEYYNNFKNFKDFIDKILLMINFQEPQGYSSVHSFTRSIYNFESKINLFYLYPENFQELNLEELNSLKSSPKRPISSNNLKNTKKLPRYIFQGNPYENNNESNNESNNEKSKNNLFTIHSIHFGNNSNNNNNNKNK